MARSRGPAPPFWLREEAQRLYGLDPVGYEAGRPDYPERVYDVLASRCGLTRGSEVLEIGPGTGRVTRHLIRLGATVVGVEPDMALVAHLSQEFPAEDLRVVSGSFEQAVLPEEGFDLAVAAMSFHWVNQEVGLAKIGRLVRRGGWAAVWWTVFGDPTRPDPFHEATKALLGEGVGPEGAPHRPQFELDVEERRRDLEDRARLADAEGELIRWTARLDAKQVRALYGSMIRLLRRPQPEREQLLDTLSAIATSDFGGVVERPFVTAMYTARRP